MKTIKFNILFLLIVYLISCSASCDNSISYNKVVQNDSDYDIWVIMTSIYSETDSILITSLSEISIFNSWDISMYSDYENCRYPFVSLDSLSTRVNGNDTLNLNVDLNDNSIWIYNKLKKAYGDPDECECRFIITNDLIK